MMDVLPEADKDMFLQVAAENLARNLGARALPYAHAALAKMRSRGDEEGLDLWIELERRLTICSDVEVHALH